MDFNISFVMCFYPWHCVLSLLSPVWLFVIDTVDCSPPGSSVHGDSPGKNIGVDCLQYSPEKRIFSFKSLRRSSRGSSQFRDQTQVSHIAVGFITIWATREAQEYWSGQTIPSAWDLPNPGIKLGSPELQASSVAAEIPGKQSMVGWM